MMKKRDRIIIWLNIFLLLINISAFTTILLMNGKTSSVEQKSDKYKSDMFLKEELNLSDEQFSQLSKLDGNVFRNYQLLIDKQCELNFDLLEELSSENPSKETLDSIAERIGRYQTLLKKQTIKHFINIRSICSDEQKILLDDLLKEMMNLKDQCALCNKKNCDRKDQLQN